MGCCHIVGVAICDATLLMWDFLQHVDSSYISEQSLQFVGRFLANKQNSWQWLCCVLMILLHDYWKECNLWLLKDFTCWKIEWFVLLSVHSVKIYWMTVCESASCVVATKIILNDTGRTDIVSFTPLRMPSLNDIEATIKSPGEFPLLLTNLHKTSSWTKFFRVHVFDFEVLSKILRVKACDRCVNWIFIRIKFCETVGLRI